VQLKREEQGIYVRGGSIITKRLRGGVRESIEKLEEEEIGIEIYCDERGEARGKWYIEEEEGGIRVEIEMGY